MSDHPLTPPVSGLASKRIAMEFGQPEEFVSSVERALARGGDRGATIVARLDLGDLSVHIPRADGPCWNSVPLLHLHRGEQPDAEAWAAANLIIEKLERYR